MNNNNEFANQPLTLGKNFFTLFCSPWKKYAKFSGRARRKELWLFTFVNTMIGVTIIAIFDVDTELISFNVYWIGFFTALMPSIALIVRRLHDAGYSWWGLLFYFLLMPMSYFLPENFGDGLLTISNVVGLALTGISYFQRGQKGANKYGADPRAVAGSIADTAFNPVAGPQRDSNPAIPSATHAERPAPFGYPMHNNSMTENDANGNAVPFDASIHDDDR